MTSTFNWLKSHLSKIAQLRHELDTAKREFRSLLPQKLREARKELGFTQADISQKLGVDISYISKLENGHVWMGQPTIKKLLELLAIDDSKEQDNVSSG